MRIHVVALSMTVLIVATPALAQVDRILTGLGAGQHGGMTDMKIASGLKEALQVGSENAVGLTGRPDGYFANEAIKILMPEQLRKLERGLRLLGYDQQVDEFVLSMNRAAEQAAPSAKQIFWDAIGEMTFDDARKIMTAGGTAATDYLKATTSGKLMAAFQPVVEQAMQEVGVTRQYTGLLGYAKEIPFVKTEPVDINRYVVNKALDGLFRVVGEQERKIRTDPAAQVTGLLKEVFGK